MALAYGGWGASEPADEAVRKAVATPKRGVGKGALDRLADFAAEHGISLADAFERADEAEVTGTSAKGIGEFLELRSAMRARAEEGAATVLRATLEASGYLDELRVDLEQASTTSGAPRDRLADIVGAFVDYSLAHPAFVDCAQALMRRSGPELLDEISESALFRLGRAISGALSILSAALEDGVEAGDFTVTDPTLLANTLYASGLGALQLARVGILVKEAAPGVPTVGEISHDQVRDYLVVSALALARGGGRG